MPAPKPNAAPIMKNATAAPFVYFDAAPAFGTFGGAVEIELVARSINPRDPGPPAMDVVCVAHLRCSAQAAANLRNALDAALALLPDTAAALRNDALRDDAAAADVHPPH